MAASIVVYGEQVPVPPAANASMHARIDETTIKAWLTEAGYDVEEDRNVAATALQEGG